MEFIEPNSIICVKAWHSFCQPRVLIGMKTERFAGHHEATQALVLSVTGVMAILLIASLILLILV
jgi:hypothetical protein